MSNDDFETFDTQEAMPQQPVSASEIFKNNPSLKIFTVVAAVGIGIAGFLIFSGGDKEAPISKVAGKSEISEVPGTSQLTPEYKKAVEEKDKQRIDEAVQTGKSVFPTPVNKTEERIDAPSVDATAEDPLEVWRKTVEEKSILSGQRRERSVEALGTNGGDIDKNALAKQFTPPVVQPVQPAAPPLPTTPSKEDVDLRMQLLTKQMTTILENRVPKPSAVFALSDVSKVVATANGTAQGGVTNLAGGLSPLAPMGAGMQGATDAQLAANFQNRNSDDIYTDEPDKGDSKPVIMPGDIAYAQMMTEANSDVVGPVLAYIASGPLAGARALGAFSKAEKHLVLTFNTAVLKKEQYSINAYAIDPATTLTGMASDVDNHYFGRIVIPAATAFLDGFASAVKDSGGTSVTVSGETVTTEKKDLEVKDELLEGASEAIKKVAEVAEEDTPDEPTVRVEAGTRMGLLFMQPVYKVEQR